MAKFDFETEIKKCGIQPKIVGLKFLLTFQESKSPIIAKTLSDNNKLKQLVESSKLAARRAPGQNPYIAHVLEITKICSTNPYEIEFEGSPEAIYFFAANLAR